MVQDQKPSTVIGDYPGLLTNSGPSALGSPAGTASIQVNAQAVRSGELTSRPGYKVVQFDDE